jgi:putative membrane protein
MKTWTSKITLALKGMAMGMAEVIPGVSGGTIAFITGIYEQLLETIKNILGLEVWQSLRKDGLSAAWQTANGNFLIFLLIGMAAGIVVGVFGITYLLETYPILLWAFFFGLIIGSAIYIGKQVSRWRPVEVLSLVIGTVVAYVITIASPAEGNSNLLMVFIAGAIAISALILPGISGSFILLLMGMYTIIIPTVKSALKTLAPESLVVVGVFGLGCLLGLATFSRLLSWTFKNFRNPTLATLTGFMLGSLNKIWPWRQAVLGLDEAGKLVDIENGMVVDKVIKEVNLLPGQYAAEVGSPQLAGAIIAMIGGLLIVFILEYMGREEKVQ